MGNIPSSQPAFDPFADVPPEWLRDDELELTLTLIGEAEGEPIEGQLAVASVIRNRVKVKWLGDTTYARVCHHHMQFSCWSGRAARLDQVRRELQGSCLGPDAVLKRCREIAHATIAGLLADNTFGACYYMTTTLYQSPQRPRWAASYKPLALGSQTFLV